MKFEDWNEELVNRYKSFRASQGCKVSTIGKDLAVIKVWLTKAHNPKNSTSIPLSVQFVQLLKPSTFSGC